MLFEDTSTSDAMWNGGHLTPRNDRTLAMWRFDCRVLYDTKQWGRKQGMRTRRSSVAMAIIEPAGVRCG